ncbi:acyl-CoA dehydrogenase family protein [Mycobacterium vicinigordonae]|uniref:Acyl-CoA/acyl-ACP dehydrogenase n=1 Tax=Mycobacterium vicinigordonae TaxID=1719132 RepID=A0A7D6E5S2_9MYCO|nr:acyl-CoA dehydrogenase family protein [Mycobacterium vicinigordonae]QLL09806.1 acyl-CoA/acyl-ACP dehydrogenase [Mycobacterium vicinigordonae]
MDFLPDSDQDALIDATRQYIESRMALANSTAQLDDVRWKEITELGWLGLAIAKGSGGSGATLLDEVFVFREIGRALVPGPILATLAAARLAAWTGDTALSANLIGGHTRVARAVALPGNNHDLMLTNADDCALTLLVDDERAAVYPTPRRSESSPGLEDGTSVSYCNRAEFGRACLLLDDATSVRRLRRVLSILTCAQLAGIAVATSDLAVDYAKNRIQFGKPIGAFQAIKHQCADMATNALAADNVTYFAALADMSSAPDDLSPDYYALAAAAFCRRAAFGNARANIHIRGAMGFTVEDTAHRFVKRSHTLCNTESFGRAAAQLGGLASAQMNVEAGEQ